MSLFFFQTNQTSEMSVEHKCQIALQRIVDASKWFGSNEHDQFIQEIQQLFVHPNNMDKSSFLQLSTTPTFDYLYLTHQYYLNKRLPEISQSITRLRELDGFRSSSLLLLQLFFKEYQKHLKEHIHLEEDTYFPAIRSKRSKEALAASLKDFFEGHEDTEYDLRRMRDVLTEYIPNSLTSTAYRILLTQLQALELDLHIHSFVEEEILPAQLLK